MAGTKSSKKGQRKIGKPGTNLEPMSRNVVVRPLSDPNYKGEVGSTKSNNPPTDKGAITSAHKTAQATGIEPRYGGNCGRKMDIPGNDDAALMRAVKANSIKTK